jgi:hypothetical protein
MKKKTSRRGIDVDVDELDRIIDAAMREPLNEKDGRTLKTAVHAMAERLVRRRNTEKTSAVRNQRRHPARELQRRNRGSPVRPGTDATRLMLLPGRRRSA